MEFQETRIYKAIAEEPFHKVAQKVRELTEAGRDVNIRDSLGLTFLHHVLDHVEKFSDARAVPVIYQLALAGIDQDVKDTQGDTCLHRVVRREGAWRVMIALIRCGADPNLKNDAGLTPEEILEQEKPTGWQETLHWLNKYTPGLRGALQAKDPDVAVVERLLKSWCRTNVRLNDQLVSLTNWAKDNDLNDQVVDLLEKHEHTNELAIAALAGSSRRVARSGETGQPDINTTDESYQYHYPHSPQIAQPLLAAVWEQDCYDVIDALLSLQPDTSVMYSNHRNYQPKPLFFHVISGRPMPEKMKIVHRIVRGSELWRKNHKGQTLIFEAMAEKVSPIFIDALLHYGVDLSSRDYKGRTPRDYADILGEDPYVECIDAYVLETVKAAEIDRLEQWVLRGYEHVSCVLSNGSDDDQQRLCEKLTDDRILKHTGAFLSSIPKIQRRIRKMFESLDAGDMLTLDRMAEGQISRAQNMCGHSLLHRALLTRQEDIIKHVTCQYSHLVDVPDNMLRTPLHYAYILYGRDCEAVRWLAQMGASETHTDVRGMRPSQYNPHNMSTFEHNSLAKDITEFDSRVYLREIGFEDTLRKAIEDGDMKQVESLMSQASKHATVSHYSDVLFDCVDELQPDIAAYLIKCGYNPDIWKQYEKCDPVEDKCAMHTCHHDLVSLEERAIQCGYHPLAHYISRVRQSKASNSDAAETNAAFQQMAKFSGAS